jgi:glycosyltransferase involved in cell wall biosynthesis
MIGIGPYLDGTKEYAKKLGVDDLIEFLGSMKPEHVREHMEKSQIHIFTSDKYEGWGAVLNEAMNSACAVVTSHAIGATPFLVQNCQNGLIYESGNVNVLECQNGINVYTMYSDLVQYSVIWNNNKDILAYCGYDKNIRNGEERNVYLSTVKVKLNYMEIISLIK